MIYKIKILLAPIIFLSFVVVLGSCQSKKDGDDLVVFSLEDSNSGKKDQISVPRKYLKKENYRGKLVFGTVRIFSTVDLVESLHAAGSEDTPREEVSEYEVTIFLRSKESSQESIRKRKELYVNTYTPHDYKLEGFSSYYVMCRLGDKCDEASSVMLFFENDSLEDPLSLQCPPSGNLKKCMAEISYRGWEVAYFFRGDMASRWKDFDLYTRNLLSNFFNDQK